MDNDEKAKLALIDSDRITLNPSLSKGTTIPPEILEKALGCKRGTERYAWELLRIIGQFRIDSRTEGDPKIIKCDKYGLRVLTDPESVKYVKDKFDSHITKAKGIHEQGEASIKSENLSNEMRALYDRQSSVRSRIIQATEALEYTQQRREIEGKQHKAQ